MNWSHSDCLNRLDFLEQDPKLEWERDMNFSKQLHFFCCRQSRGFDTVTASMHWERERESFSVSGSSMEKPELSPNTESYYPPTIVQRISNGDMWWCSLYEQCLSELFRSSTSLSPRRTKRNFTNRKTAKVSVVLIPQSWQVSDKTRFPKQSIIKHHRPISSTIHIW
jgi:hypothetical protein